MIAKILALGALPAAFGAVTGDWPSGSKHHDVPSVTSTVYATSTYTVSSCAPEKTDCPLRGKGPVVVTEVKPLYTTVCPAEEAKPTSAAQEIEWGCSTSTSYSECVHTITSTLPPVVVTTKIPTTTVAKTAVETEYSTCVHTVTTASWPYVVTTLIPTETVTKAVTETEYSTCVHTVTNATTVYPVTTSSAVAYTVCPVKPTGGSWSVPVESEAPGSWPAPPASSWAAAPSVPAASWPAGAAKPTASWTKTASPAVVTAGAAAFGASGAIKMLGAAAAAAALVL